MPDDVATSRVVLSPQDPRAHASDRLRWAMLPRELRDEIEATMEAHVVEEISVVSGFSPGMGSLLRLSTGGQVFLKAARTRDERECADLHRAEARIATRLPSTVPTPRFLWGHGDGDWIVLAYEAIDGYPPQVPWEPAVLARVLDTLDDLARVPGARQIPLPPAGPQLASTAIGWGRMLREPWEPLGALAPWAARRLAALAELELGVLVACEGESIVHGDMRARNLTVTDDRVYVLDWPYAMRGAGWLDLAHLLVTVGSQGVDGVFDPPEVCVPTDGSPPLVTWDDAERAGAWLTAVFDDHPLGAEVHPGDLRSIVGGFAGFSMDATRRPAPRSDPCRPTVALGQSVSALAWLEHLGL
ncbi:phosphotransferase [Oerskovia gallyi]|uniref:Phosphotransferase n=1 Tax=Oerskovia gallyi TaxID=2762226 RepID=A0ABR8V6U8_9CELL|nr:phosphotransferase [Oerskovia gallyi]MBD8000509.1 phosphotransferase [Oerskovia gallyi]